MAKDDVPAVVTVAGWIGELGSELVSALREHGATDEEIRGFVTDGCKASMRGIADGLIDTVRSIGRTSVVIILDCSKPIDYPSLGRMYDRTDLGWVLLEDDVPPTGLVKFEAVKIVGRGEFSIQKDELLRRTEMFDINAGRHHAIRLVNQQSGIPKRCRGKIHFHFPKTRWRKPDGSEVIWAVIWVEAKGEWSLGETNHDFLVEDTDDRHDRLVRVTSI